MAEIQSRMVQMLPRLRRFARGLAGSAAAADDLVQAACERALRAADTWEEGTRFDSWMYRIVRNLWIDDRRKARMDSLDVGGDFAGDDGVRVAEARLAVADVQIRIATLPEAQREILMLVCVEDVSYREASEILGIPIGTVMSRLARARTALADALGETEQDGARGAAR